jgi:autotransporter-associated beta strand protein
VSFAGSLSSSNTAGLVKLGAGELTLAASNGYTGTTLVSGGSLVLADPNAISGSTFDTSGTGSFSFGMLTSATFGGLQGSGNLTLGNTSAAAVSLSVGGNNASTTFSGSLGGKGGLTLLGAGAMTLDASNGYTGTTLVANGTLLLADTGAISGSTFDTSGAGSLSFGTLASAAFGGLQGSGNLALNNVAAAAVALSVGGNNASTTFSGSLSGSGSLTKLGSGTFSLTGPNNFSGNATVSAGTLQILGGQLQLPAATEYVAASGTAGVVQSGGTCSVSLLSFGINGGSGTYNLSGNGLLSAQNEYSYYGNDSFTQSGGTNLVSTALVLGYFSSGSYTLSGGGLLSARREDLGGYGSGHFTQSGGTNSVSSNLFIGSNLGGSGTYTLSGSGLLSAASEYVGYSPGTGALTQLGGTNTAGYVDLTGSRYLLSAGLLQINGGLQTATGTLDGGGGSAVILAGSSSLVDLSGKIVNTASTSLTVGANSLVIVSPGFNPAAAFHPYSNLGLTHTAGTTLTVSAGQGFGGWGTINDPVNCQGTIAATPSGAINLTNGLTLSGTGQVTLGSGALTINDSISGISGGSLSADSLVVASTATGIFTQSGGTTTLTPYGSGLYLGNNPGSSGTYNLSGGGLLSGATEYVGYSGSGSFTQTGGTHSVSYALYLGYSVGGSGTYNLSGSGLLSTPSVQIGVSGTASFTQTGGTHSVQDLSVGGFVVGSGTYSLSGSALLSAYVESISGSGANNFTQTGGTNSLSGGLYVAEDSGSGSYNLSGSGLLSVPYEYVGYASPDFSATGSFTQSGGTNAVSGFLTIASGGSSSAGTFNLSGSGLLSAPYEYVAYYGTGSFTQLGGTNSVGSVVLAQSAGSTGTYNLNGGLLRLSSLTQGAGSAAFNFSGGTFQAGSTFSTSVPIVFSTAGSNGTFDTNGNTLTLAAAVSGPGGLRVIGLGTLILAGSNTYTGLTSINAGTLTLAHSAALAGDGNITFGGGTLQFTASNTVDYSNRIINSSSPIQIDTNGQNVSFFATLAGSNTAGLTKIGGGSLTLAGSNTYTGLTSINAGTLSLAHSAALAGNGNITFGGGTLQFTASNTLDYASRIINSTGPIQIDTNGQNVSFFGTLAGSNTAGLTKIGGGMLTLANSQNYAGATKITGGTVTLVPPQLNLTNLQLELSAASGVVANGGTVSQWNDLSGHGHNATFVASAIANSANWSAPAYTNGTVTFSGSQALMAPLPAGTLNSGFTLFVVAQKTGAVHPAEALVERTGAGPNDQTNGNIPGPFDFDLTNGSLIIGNASPASYTGYATGLSASTLATRSLVTVMASSSIVQEFVNGAATLATTANSTYGDSSNYLYLATRADGFSHFTGNMEEVLLYSGTMNAAQQQQVWSNLNAQWGTSGGTAAASSAGALPATSAVTISGSATLDLNAASQSIGSLSSNDPNARVILGGGALTLGGDNSTTSFAGDIADSGGASALTGGSLIKTGTGTFTLAGSNTYSGGTTVAAGTLEVLTSSALPNGTSLTVGGGALLAFGSPIAAPPAAAGAQAVPEPSTLALLAAGGMLLFGIRSRRWQPRREGLV